MISKYAMLSKSDEEKILAERKRCDHTEIDYSYFNDCDNHISCSLHYPDGKCI